MIPSFRKGGAALASALLLIAFSSGASAECWDCIFEGSSNWQMGACTVVLPGVTTRTTCTDLPGGGCNLSPNMCEGGQHEDEELALGDGSIVNGQWVATGTFMIVQCDNAIGVIYDAEAESRVRSHAAKIAV